MKYPIKEYANSLTNINIPLRCKSVNRIGPWTKYDMNFYIKI